MQLNAVNRLVTIERSNIFMSDDRKKSSYRQLHFVKRHFLPLGLGFLFMQIIAKKPEKI